MTTISSVEAYKLIENSSKCSHSILVSKIMSYLSKRFYEDEDEWEMVGLLHDLDYDLVRGDPSRHGIVASETLKGRLPDRCLQAIKCHDHRTGLKAESLLDQSLIFADSLAIIIEDHGFDLTLIASKVNDIFQKENESKPWITENILTYLIKYKIELRDLLKSLSI